MFHYQVISTQIQYLCSQHIHPSKRPSYRTSRSLAQRWTPPPSHTTRLIVDLTDDNSHPSRSPVSSRSRHGRSRLRFTPPPRSKSSPPSLPSSIRWDLPGAILHFDSSAAIATAASPLPYRTHTPLRLCLRRVSTQPLIPLPA
jgi:hypothetical protein